MGQVSWERHLEPGQRKTAAWEHCCYLIWRERTFRESFPLNIVKCKGRATILPLSAAKNIQQFDLFPHTGTVTVGRNGREPAAGMGKECPVGPGT